MGKVITLIRLLSLLRRISSGSLAGSGGARGELSVVLIFFFFLFFYSFSVLFLFLFSIFVATLNFAIP